MTQQQTTSLTKSVSSLSGNIQNQPLSPPKPILPQKLKKVNSSSCLVFKSSFQLFSFSVLFFVSFCFYFRTPVHRFQTYKTTCAVFSFFFYFHFTFTIEQNAQNLTDLVNPFSFFFIILMCNRVSRIQKVLKSRWTNVVASSIFRFLFKTSAL